MLIYERVHVLDYSSLYPNIIRQLRLSPEFKYSNNYTDDLNTNLVIDKKELHKEHGVLDGYITDLLKLRQEYRSNGKDAEQQACKIIVNSVYGLLSQKTAKFILGGTNIASTVTYIGRTLLHRLVEELPNEGITVVYGKTDSIFVISDKSDKEVLEIAQKYTDKIIKELTGFENDYIKFDYEEFLQKFLIINKNNYIKVYTNNKKVKGASLFNTKMSQFDIDMTNYLLDKIIEGEVFYKRDVTKIAFKYLNSKINKEPLSYFSIKHKPRREPINKWDNVEYMHMKDIDVEYNFYHYACIVNGVRNSDGVLVYPIGHEPNHKLYKVNRKWLEGNLYKLIKKLDLQDRNLQMSLDKFFR